MFNEKKCEKYEQMDFRVSKVVLPPLDDANEPDNRSVYSGEPE